MANLEKLFEVGYINEIVEILDVKFGITVLDTRKLTDALNASVDVSEDAKLLHLKCEILARAITSINGKSTFNDVNNPTLDEIDKTLNTVLARLHFTVINALFEAYQKLDSEIIKVVSDDVKKSLSNRGV